MLMLQVTDWVGHQQTLENKGGLQFLFGSHYPSIESLTSLPIPGRQVDKRSKQQRVGEDGTVYDVSTVLYVPPKDSRINFPHLPLTKKDACDLLGYFRHSCPPSHHIRDSGALFLSSGHIGSRSSATATTCSVTLVLLPQPMIYFPAPIRATPKVSHLAPSLFFFFVPATFSSGGVSILCFGLLAPCVCALNSTPTATHVHSDTRTHILFNSQSTTHALITSPSPGKRSLDLQHSLYSPTTA